MAEESRLRPEAVELLLRAVDGEGACEGVIALTKTDHSTSLSIGQEHKTLRTEGDAARYEAALHQLSDRRLIEAKTADVWHVTADGRAKANELLSFGQQSQEWDG
jgi:hypothetical protein